MFEVFMDRDTCQVTKLYNSWSYGDGSWPVLFRQLAELLLACATVDQIRSEATVSTYIDRAELMSKIRKTILNDIDATTSTASKRSLQNDFKDNDEVPKCTKIDDCFLVTSPQYEQAQPLRTSPHRTSFSDVSSDFVPENDSKEYSQDSDDNYILELSDRLLEEQQLWLGRILEKQSWIPTSEFKNFCRHDITQDIMKHFSVRLETPNNSKSNESDLKRTLEILTKDTNKRKIDSALKVIKMRKKEHQTICIVKFSYGKLAPENKEISDGVKLARNVI
ncbi:11464_t:CDS:2 [Funneliformis caledonium]|uniref:11464_t:CDS:1 n=1 Tax=Funneliformis caledonium TaxID=1117310 RepID=A0A9N9FEZ5_9GLOM|nr:11464_t:CDS:2 [Funneliformis caledonium]